MNSNHAWKFFRAGGFDQVQLDSAADLLALPELDQKLWVALNCPTRGIEFDSRTLDMIDADGDGQVRASEMLAAIRWAGALLKDGAVLATGMDTLALANIDETSEEGQLVLASARHVLKNLGKPDASEITLAEMTDIEKFLSGLQFNGDGVICAEQVVDAELRTTLELIVQTLGSVPDMSGGVGIDQEIAERFFNEARAYAAWYARSDADASLLPLGAQSFAAADALQAVRRKVDDYFVRCQMAAYDERAALPLSRSAEDYQKLAGDSLDAQHADVAAFPLSPIGANKALPLSTGINPAWQDKVHALRERVVVPVLGDRDNITLAEWSAVCAKFANYDAWHGDQPTSAVAGLGITRIREILSGNQESAIFALIAQDKAVAGEVQAIRSVERLIRYQRDLFRLANNFVSFRDFYSGRGKATFQVGTLYLDGRSCELCIRVEDVNAHAAYANSSGVCLAYCELERKSSGEKMNIAAAFTAGDADFLMVGRHGIFYDRKGQDWNATIVRILDHPISIRQAFWSPYKKLMKAVSEQMQKLAASKANTAQDKLVQAVLDDGRKVAAGAPAAVPKPAFDVAKFAGVFAAIGLAIGAIGGILASIVGGLLSLKLWQAPLALAGLLLAVSGPSMILAWFKLKRRNLGPILDACGWAINARVRINIPFGTSLTAMPVLPAGAQRSLADPYAEKKSAWPFLIVILLLLGALAWAWQADILAGLLR